jgi:hypothetical protein
VVATHQNFKNVLDVGVKKLFKGFVRDAHEDWWIIAHPHGLKVK